MERRKHMGKLEETQEAYYGQEEKVIVEKDRMSFPHALMILHRFRDRNFFGENVEEAFQVVFEWIDNMALLIAWERLKKDGLIIPDSLADAPGADQDDRSGA